MFISVVNRYDERLTLENETLSAALGYYGSDECFFVGAVDTESGKAYIPKVTAIGFSQGEALLQIIEATGRQINAIELF